MDHLFLELKFMKCTSQIFVAFYFMAWFPHISVHPSFICDLFHGLLPFLHCHCDTWKVFITLIMSKHKKKNKGRRYIVFLTRHLSRQCDISAVLRDDYKTGGPFQDIYAFEEMSESKIQACVTVAFEIDPFWMIQDSICNS